MTEKLTEEGLYTPCVDENFPSNHESNVRQRMNFIRTAISSLLISLPIFQSSGCVYRIKGTSDVPWNTDSPNIQVNFPWKIPDKDRDLLELQIGGSIMLSLSFPYYFVKALSKSDFLSAVFFLLPGSPNVYLASDSSLYEREKFIERAKETNKHELIEVQSEE